MKAGLTIGELAGELQLNPKTIRYYEEVELLQDWYERHWKEADDISEEILKVIERHTCEYSPFEVYAKHLLQFFILYWVRFVSSYTISSLGKFQKSHISSSQVLIIHLNFTNNAMYFLMIFHIE